MVVTYERVSKLIEFTQDSKRKEMKISKKQRHLAIVLLQWLRFNC